MAFTPPAGLKRQVSTKTRKDIERTNVMLGLVDRSDEARFRAGEERLFMQARTFAGGAASDAARSDKTNTDGNIRKWSNLKTSTASEVTVALRAGKESGYGIPRLDALQSPLAEVEAHRRKVSSEINTTISDEIAAFFLGLASTGGAGANGNAGAVSKVVVGTAGTNYISNTAPYAKTGFANTDPMLDIIDDFTLFAKRNNLIDGVSIYGAVPATLYMAMHAELFLYHVVKVLRNKGWSFDPLTEATLRRASVFGTGPFTGQLGLQKIVIVCPNELTVPTGNNNWQFWGGYTEAVVGGIGPMISQLISPDENQIGDGWAIRQVVNPYYNLLTGSGIRQYEIHVN